METVIIQSPTHSKMEALKAFLTALKMDFKIVSEGKAAEMTNPETLRRIDDFEQGRTQLEEHTLDEIKAMFRA